MRTHPRRLPWFVIGWLALAGVVAQAQPEIRNRPAAPDEWGYRPADDERVSLNPPSLTWVHEKDATTYSVQWSLDPRFRNAQTARDVPWPVYTHHEPLPPGEYHWRYRSRNAKGDASSWSVSRRFTVPEDAVAFPMPTRAQQRASVPAMHPRLFLRPEDLPRIREAALADGEPAQVFAGLRRQADRLIEAGPTPEPEHLGSARDKDNAEMVKYWWPNREQTQKACQEAEVLAFVAMITGEPKYREAARRWILHLAAWDPDGPTNFALNCEAAKPMLYRLPRAYDWAFDALSDKDQATVREVMSRRIDDAWKSGEMQQGVGHLNRPYNSHGNRIWHKVGEAGIAFLGEIPEAETWLDYAVNKFFACYPVWSDADGGWHEGVSYWGGYLSKVVWWLQVQQAALGIDGMKKPFFAQVGDFPLYLAPPGSPNMGFGDLAHRPPSASWGGFLEYFLRASANSPVGNNAGHWRWWADQYAMRGESGILGFLYLTNLPAMPEPVPPKDLPPSKVFHGIGVASLHTNLLDSRDDVHLLFKSSPFGSRSHGHNPQNSFQLNAYGEPLLTTCVYRDLHGSKFHYQWAHSTVAHNAVLINGQGQKMHTWEPQGEIVAELLTPAYDFITGDATLAYEGRVTHALRHVVLVKGEQTPTPFLVIYDDVLTPEPSTFQIMLHALVPFTISEGDSTLTAQRPGAGVMARYLDRDGQAVAFRQWDGYDPPPTREFPNQWHVEAGTTTERPRLEMLTVLMPYRDDQAPAWDAERIDSADALGVRLTIDGKPVEVAFRRAEIDGPATWNGHTFDAPVRVAP